MRGDITPNFPTMGTPLAGHIVCGYVITISSPPWEHTLIVLQSRQSGECPMGYAAMHPSTTDLARNISKWSLTK